MPNENPSSSYQEILLDTALDENRRFIYPAYLKPFSYWFQINPFHKFFTAIFAFTSASLLILSVLLAAGVNSFFAAQLAFGFWTLSMAFFTGLGTFIHAIRTQSKASKIRKEHYPLGKPEDSQTLEYNNLSNAIVLHRTFIAFSLVAILLPFALYIGFSPDVIYTALGNLDKFFLVELIISVSAITFAISWLMHLFHTLNPKEIFSKPGKRTAVAIISIGVSLTGLAVGLLGVGMQLILKDGVIPMVLGFSGAFVAWVILALSVSLPRKNEHNVISEKSSADNPKSSFFVEPRNKDILKMGFLTITSSLHRAKVTLRNSTGMETITISLPNPYTATVGELKQTLAKKCHCTTEQIEITRRNSSVSSSDPVSILFDHSTPSSTYTIQIKALVSSAPLVSTGLTDVSRKSMPPIPNDAPLLSPRRKAIKLPIYDLISVEYKEKSYHIRRNNTVYLATLPEHEGNIGSLKDFLAIHLSKPKDEIVLKRDGQELQDHSLIGFIPSGKSILFHMRLRPVAAVAIPGTVPTIGDTVKSGGPTLLAAPPHISEAVQASVPTVAAAPRMV